MPFAFIRFLRRSPGAPDNSLPDGGGNVDNSLPGDQPGVDNGLPIPPLPGIWPKPGVPTLPIHIPPEVALPPFPTPPIYIEVPPDATNPIPPGEIWPPLPPEYAGKIVAVAVLGEGKVHWYHVPPPSTNPPQPQPKR